MTKFQFMVVLVTSIGSLLLANGTSVLYAADPEEIQAAYEEMERLAEEERESGLTIWGEVINGTSSEASVEGLVVILHQHHLDEIHDLEQIVGPDGLFLFEGVVYDSRYSYGISVDYQGAIYGVDLDLSTGTLPPLEIRIYQSLHDDSILTVVVASILFARADKATETIEILEIVRLANDSNMTYLPGPEPMQLLRFGLPVDAFNLQMDTTLKPAEFFRVDLGFAVSASIPPGEHEIFYSYVLPYSSGRITIEKNFRYGAAQIRVVAPKEIMTFDAGSLGTPELKDIGGRPYYVLERTDLSKGRRVIFTLSDLPRATFGERVGRNVDNIRWELAAPIALGVVLIGLIGFAVFWKSRSNPRNQHKTDQSISDEREIVLGLIADLDRKKRNEDVDEEAYRRRRTLLINRLNEIWSSAESDMGDQTLN